jgi:hypothetical protein
VIALSAIDAAGGCATRSQSSLALDLKYQERVRIISLLVGNMKLLGSSNGKESVMGWITSLVQFFLAKMSNKNVTQSLSGVIYTDSENILHVYKVSAASFLVEASPWQA